MAARLKSGYDGWRTPPWLVEAVRRCFDGEIALDPCASPEHRNWFGSRNLIARGLSTQWVDRTFVNPPYSEMAQWVSWLRLQVTHHRVALLMPCGSRSSTKYYQESVLNASLSAMVVFGKRIQFLGGHGKANIHDSVLMLYNVRVENVVECFRGMGRVLEVRTWS